MLHVANVAAAAQKRHAPQKFNEKRVFAQEFPMLQRLNVIPRTELCKQLGVSRSTIKRWITQRDFPSPIPASGREPLFNMKAVQDWLDTKGEQHD